MSNEDTAPDSAPDVDPARAALVDKWLSRVKAAKKHHSKVMKQIDKDQFMAIHGCTKEWKEAKNYVVPVVKNYIDSMVAKLYARDPVSTAKPRHTMRFAVWDGREDSLNAAMEMAQQGDPNAMAIIQDVLQGRQEEDQAKRVGQTLQILWKYYTTQQANGFRKQMKAVVRRVKVCKVGFLKLSFQRVLEPQPEIVAQIEDCTSQLSATERLLQEHREGKFEADEARAEELRLLLQQLQDQEYLVVREGPVFDFPKTKAIIVDPDCVHLKTFAGARWVAHEFDLSADKIQEIYGVDVKDGGATATSALSDWNEGQTTPEGSASKEAADKKADKFRCYEIQDKQNSQFLTICEGHKDFLKEPAEPDVKIDRFWTLFPIVFNEVESDDEIYPPSDVELLHDTQMEINRARQGLREHRQAGRPRYGAVKGRLSLEDKEKLSSPMSHSIIEFDALSPGTKMEDLFGPLKTVAIDPNLYDVNQLYADIPHCVSGSQDQQHSDDASATQSSIIAQGGMSSLADNVDDLDEVLSDLALATGQLCMLELSKDTVMEIAGRGAVWPDAAPTRQSLSQNIVLDVKAGSSGRPNRAAELADCERAIPILLQIPGVPPAPVARRILSLLNIDVEEDIAEGAPSITAMNAMMAKQAAGVPSQGGGAPGAPQAQGPHGATNAPVPPGGQGPQPGMPAPGTGATPNVNGGNSA